MPYHKEGAISGDQRRFRGDRMIFVFRDRRYDSKLQAKLREGEQAQAATVTNMSSAGFQAVTATPVTEGRLMILQVEDTQLPAISRWGDEKKAGFEFLEELAPQALEPLLREPESI